jgi:hypothetical protein
MVAALDVAAATHANAANSMLTRVSWTRTKGTLIVIHRWLGVPLSLFFALWFPSAIGTMYFDFPSVTAADRLAHADAIDPRMIRIPLDLDDSPQELRLNTFDGRPAYRIRIGRIERVMFADTGELRGRASTALMRHTAARWAARPETDARVDEVVAVDQWTVQGPLKALRPLWRFSFGDGQQVYIAQATGEVVQATTTASRIGAYLGPIPHWMYFTPLRQRQQLWSAVVIWSSGFATVAAAIGLVIGVWMSAPNARVPYRGQKRLHAIAGLIFGAGAVTWAFSGMLSMDPFPALDAPRPTLHVRAPLSLAAFTRTPAGAIDALAPLRVKELEWVSLLGEPAYLATVDDGTTRVVPMHGSPARTFDVDRMTAVLGADGQTVSVLDHFDAYYRDRHHRKPLPVLHALPSGAYVDPATARVVDSYSSADWATRWLYHGLHSLDFPWLYDRRPLWDAIVIVLMVGGTALSVTSLILAWRVARGFRPARPRP